MAEESTGGSWSFWDFVSKDDLQSAAGQVIGAGAKRASSEIFEDRKVTVDQDDANPPAPAGTVSKAVAPGAVVRGFAAETVEIFGIKMNKAALVVTGVAVLLIGGAIVVKRLT